MGTPTRNTFHCGAVAYIRELRASSVPVGNCRINPNPTFGQREKQGCVDIICSPGTITGVADIRLFADRLDVQQVLCSMVRLQSKFMLF
ncbi:MAG: hypothetical protein R3B95_03320 [Nitrospirales bacterium]|nr:hypothetical protein [Nitrospirales bacterium]